MKKNDLLMASCLLAAAGSTLALAGPAPTAVRAPQLPGVDVSISAIAAGPSGNKDILIYTQATSATTVLELPAGMFTIAMGTTSCNQQPNSGPPTARFPSGTGIVAGSPYWMGDWYQAWESGPNWDGTALGADAGSRHPYIAQAVYRINAAGRLEQLSTAWVKHSWSAASSNQGAVSGSNGQDICGTGTCLNLNTDNQLEANCADTYGSGLNASQYWSGPRSEIFARREWGDGSAATSGWNNPGWLRTGSYMDAYTSSDTLVTNVAQRTDGTRSLTGGVLKAWKMNQVRYDEVDQAALGASGRVVCEGYYVTNGDNYKLNNVAHRLFTSSVATGATTIASSNLNFAGRHTWGPVVLQWGEVKSVAEPASDGSVFVSSRAVDLGGGQWRYEYCVYNLDLDRQIDRFEVPVPSFATKTDFGFHMPRQNWPGYDNAAAWVSSYDDAKKTLVWSAPAAPVLSDTELAALKPPQAPGTVIKPNTLKWGTTYTFWFTSNLSPTSAKKAEMNPATAGTFAGMMMAEVRSPRHPADLGVQGGSAGSDGVLDNNDFIAFIDMFFAANASADIGQQGGIAGSDGQFNNNDFVVFIDFFFQS